MCGIFGLIGRTSTCLEQSLVRATGSMAHRGPDDEGTQVLPFRSDPARSIALGARRLAILDLSAAGHQPMYDPQRGTWLVFNGEIFNHLEIRSELERRGLTFSSRSDTEVLLKAYGEWGDDCLHRLRGMFAFAIWDSEKERLLLARDRLGEKPLYYFSSKGGFGFSSELRALLASGIIERRLDAAGMLSYLAFGSVQAPRTMLEEVRSLLPGEKLVWKNGQSTEEPYWSLAQVASQAPATGSVAEASDTVRKILLESVSLRLISDVPLGIFLSGGVDSSCLLALASEVSRHPLMAFSVVCGEREYSEGEYAENVARVFGARHVKLEVREEQLFDALQASLCAMDQPSIDGVNTYLISRAAKRAGMTVALSGLGGDELFAGYSYFRTAPWMVRFRSLTGWTRPFWAMLERPGDNANSIPHSKLKSLLTGNYMGEHPYFLCRTLFLPPAIRRLVRNKELAPESMALPESVRNLAGRVRPLDAVNHLSVLEGRTYMSNTLLRDTDFMSMAHSLEVRCPLVDHKLWEYVLPLGRRLKLDSRLPKSLLIKAAGQRLPREIYSRPKMGFTLPFDRWLRGPLRMILEQELTAQEDKDAWPIDPPAAGAVWRAFLGGKTNWARPWSLFVLKRWIRQNLAPTATV